MKHKERGVAEKRPSAVSSVSPSHFLSPLCGFLGEKVDSGRGFTFRFERKEAGQHHGEGGGLEEGGGHDK